jgi:hypothetical protein
MAAALVLRHVLGRTNRSVLVITGAATPPLGRNHSRPPRREGEGMRYRVVCDNQVPVDQPKTHAHIVEVGTGTTPQHYDRLWSVAEVIAANGRGDVFYTLSASAGEAARVIVVGCSVCGQQIIRSSADAITDNNLDSLPDCVR